MHERLPRWWNPLVSALPGDASRRLVFVAVAALLQLCTSSAGAFSVERSEPRYVDKQFRYELIVVLDAPISCVETVLRDYEHYPALDARILQAQVLARPAENVVMLKTRLRACFGPFCRNIERVERVEESLHELIAVTDASRSDVKFGETHTSLTAVPGDRTRVSYRTGVVPGFWVPPIVGRRWMLRQLEDATGDLFRNVERRAREEQERRMADRGEQDSG